nr:hypothetical protein [Tanacetum cinerariifolium]
MYCILGMFLVILVRIQGLKVCVFRQIPVDFTKVPDDDTTLAFLIELGYKGPLYKENVEYLELILEDLAYQIDHRKEKRSRRKNMSFFRFTKIIINHFLKQHMSLSNLKYQHYHTIKDDESHQVFIKYFTGQISPRRAEAKEEEEARKVHAAYARIVSKTIPEPTRRRPSGIEISDPPKKLKSVPSLTLEEQEAVNTMKALKESKKTNRRQLGTEGSNEGTGSKPRVPDEFTVILATLNEGTGVKLGVPDEEKVTTREKVILDDNQDADDEDAKTESDKDEIYKYKIRVRKDEDVEMTNAEIKGFDKGDEEVTDAAKADAKKTLEVKDDTNRRQLGTEGSNEGTGSKPGVPDEFTVIPATLNEGTGAKLGVPNEEKVTTREKMTNAEIEGFDKGDEEVTDAAKADAKKTLEVKDDVKSKLPPPTSSSLSISLRFSDQSLKLSSNSSLVSIVKDTTDAKINSLLEVKIQSEVPHIQYPSMLRLRVAKLEKDVSELKKIDLSAEAIAALKTQVPTIVDDYLGSKVRDTPTINLEQESMRSPSDILKIKREQAEKQKMPHFTVKTTDKETPKGKAPSKGSKTGKSASAKEPVEEPITEVVMDDAGDDVINDDNQPQDAFKSKTDKTPEWFKQPPRPLTPD